MNCACCGALNEIDAKSLYSVQSNVRQYQTQSFHVWRCRNCQGIHAWEPQNLEEIYNHYPMSQQKSDLPTRLFFRNRLQLLVRNGMLDHHTILDYGGGTGLFVKYLKELGYNHSVNYDPYVADFCDLQVLQTQFDFVLLQDVLEHVEDPLVLLKRLIVMVKKDGYLVIGTPNAGTIDLKLNNARHSLHQPYHRHIFAQSYLLSLLKEKMNLEVIEVARSYLESYIPSLNSRFLEEYLDSFDGCLNSGFDQRPTWKHFFLHPKLLFYMFFGRLLDRKHDDTLVLRKNKVFSPEA